VADSRWTLSADLQNLLRASRTMSLEPEQLSTAAITLRNLADGVRDVGDRIRYSQEFLTDDSWSRISVMSEAENLKNKARTLGAYPEDLCSTWTGAAAEAFATAVAAYRLAHVEGSAHLGDLIGELTRFGDALPMLAASDLEPPAPVESSAAGIVADSIDLADLEFALLPPVDSFEATKKEFESMVAALEAQAQVLEDTVLRITTADEESARLFDPQRLLGLDPVALPPPDPELPTSDQGQPPNDQAQPPSDQGQPPATQTQPPSSTTTLPPVTPIVAVPTTTVATNPNAALTERLAANIWNKYGGLLAPLSAGLNIDPCAAVAVLAIESGGRGFAPGPDGQPRLLIRFENHIFFDYWGKEHEAEYFEHFKFDAGKRWQGHAWRANAAAPWLEFHGRQNDEWQVFTFARGLHETHAILSISMGGPQIMGFNFKTVGFASALQMFEAFSSGEQAQIEALFRFFGGSNPPSKRVAALQNLDFTGFAALYNGSGQAEHYGGLMRNVYESCHAAGVK
jgi:hypothetical protein